MSPIFIVAFLRGHFMDGARRADHINSDRRKTHQVSARLRLAKLIGALDVALAPHLVHLLARLRRGVVAVLLDPEMSRASDVEIGWGQFAIRSPRRRAR